MSENKMFRKRESIDILDIPELHRKKLIKLPDKEKHEEVKISKDGYFDLSQNNQTQNPITQSPQIQNARETKPETSQVTNFLSDFASIGSSNSTIQQTQENSEVKDNSEIKDLKWRLENLEFKLEQLIERVNSSNR